MLDVLDGFVAELRRSGVAVAVNEVLDAANAVQLVPLDNRELLRSALRATLVKSEADHGAFATAFDVYFSIRLAGGGRSNDAEGDLLGATSGLCADPGSSASPTAADSDGDGDEIGAARIDAEQLRALASQALRRGDSRRLAAIAHLAVRLHAALDPSRPVGVSYYVHRTLRALGLDEIIGDLLSAALGASPGDDADMEGVEVGGMSERLLADELDERGDELKRLIEEEVRRQLVDARGVDAVAGTLRRPPIEELDVMHATGAELEQLHRALRPLARALAVRLSRRRRHQRRGALDVRATLRRSLSSGGVPIEPRFRATRPAKPELVVVADVSGSVASWARFTLHLVYAMASQFSKVRTFVFVDGIDEVTKMLLRSSTIEEAIARVGSEAEVIGHDGHSDYGRAFGMFAARWLSELGGRCDLIILGDARSNYHPANAQALALVAERVRHVYWLNPEPRAYWDTGDSIIGQYTPFLEAVYECRNLAQLEEFVAQLR